MMIGVDEAGRGSWAGPLVATAVQDVRGAWLGVTAVACLFVFIAKYYLYYLLKLAAQTVYILENILENIDNIFVPRQVDGGQKSIEIKEIPWNTPPNHPETLKTQRL